MIVSPFKDSSDFSFDSTRVRSDRGVEGSLLGVEGSLFSLRRVTSAP
jgi:hypothetical protein